MSSIVDGNNYIGTIFLGIWGNTLAAYSLSVLS